MSKNLAKKLIAWMLAAGMLLTSVSEVGWAAEGYPEAEADQAEMELTEELTAESSAEDVVSDVISSDESSDNGPSSGTLSVDDLIIDDGSSVVTGEDSLISGEEEYASGNNEGILTADESDAGNYDEFDVGSSDELDDGFSDGLDTRFPDELDADFSDDLSAFSKEQTDVSSDEILDDLQEEPEEKPIVEYQYLPPNYLSDSEKELAVQMLLDMDPQESEVIEIEDMA